MFGEPHPSLSTPFALQSERKHLPPRRSPHMLSPSLSTAHTAITAAASYPAHADVRASNLSSIKAMQREFVLACHRKKGKSGESFEQVDR